MKDRRHSLGLCAALWASISSLCATGGYACYCASDIFDDNPNAVSTAVSEASAIFRGKVEALEADAADSPADIGTRAQVAVDERWKGPVEGTLLVNTPSQVCPVDLVVGEEYLFYAFRDGSGLFVTACSRTRPLSRAGYDVPLLNQAARRLDKK